MRKGKGDRDGKGGKKSPIVLILIIGAIALLVVAVLAAIVTLIYCWRKRIHNKKTASAEKPTEQLGNRNTAYPELEFTGSIQKKNTHE